MGNRNEVREFLASRRAKVTPDQAGLPRFGGQRRVPRLRRGEVAMLAGVSSEEFRTRWAAHNVHLHRTGVKHFQHPVVGRLDLDFESLELTADSGLTLIACSAEPGDGLPGQPPSPSELGRNQ